MAQKIPRLFVPLDMNYLRDPAIRRAGPDAELLYVRSLAHAKSGNTDGIIWTFDLDVIGVGLKQVQARAAALVREKLWTEVDGGWYIRSWSKWNKTGDEIEAEKQQKHDAAVKANHERWHEQQPNQKCPICNPLRIVR